MKKKTVHIISHSHWDREWYLPLERHKMKLLDLIDTNMELFDKDPGFYSFHLDGQTIVLDDYLEIRPEKREELLRHVREGHFRVGPFYILQDEFLTSGEANVRNIQTGIREAKAYGNLTKVGYFPDAFGNGFPLQLGKDRRDIHHGTPHGGAGVELLADGDEVNVPVAQVLDELGKVADVAADAVEAVDHDGGKGDLLGVLHHFLELRALQIAAGKALVLVDQHVFRRFLAKVHGDVLAAKLDLVLNALALAGKFGLAGVDDVLLRLRFVFRFHSGTSRYSLGW